MTKEEEEEGGSAARIEEARIAPTSYNGLKSRPR